MAESSVHFEGVWKKFRRGELHDSLRDLIPAISRRIMGRRPPASQLGSADFWAVRDVSFTVLPGETLGIIGGNGAGKSTALKMLTKILRPTVGWCEIRGRVGALIEVSAGFHPDLTGRENVFLQGAIRGMPSASIRRQFDSIVDFSGIADFIDTPVKRYSSGMNARLGFSIAAHLDSEVLIIDEVLAVGDFEFQQKAFGRIHDMATSGIPVVIVSHQLERIATLCSKAILLDHGSVVHAGTPAECILRYTEGSSSGATPANQEGPVRLQTCRAETDLPVESGSDIRIDLTGVIAADAADLDTTSLYIGLRSAQTGAVPYFTSTGRLGIPLPPEGDFRLQIVLQLNLNPGMYVVETAVYSERESRILTQGPRCHLQVREGQDFTGVVQLNPRISVHSSATAPAGS
jgi:ABC-type polysaccharide/polyol phosphate transport system ATPase subunit